MPSTKVGPDKRQRLPRPFSYSSKFLKDWQRFSRAGRSDMARLKRLMLTLIADDGPLPAEWRDHALAGEWQGVRDVHIHGDFLLLYRITEVPETIVFERIGTHSELF